MKYSCVAGISAEWGPPKKSIVEDKWGDTVIRRG